LIAKGSILNYAVFDNNINRSKIMSAFTKSSEYLVFGWWNTSLSPPRGKTKGDYETKLAMARQIIGHLAESGVDFIGVSEVNNEDIQALYSVFAELGYAYGCIEGTEKIKRSKFDLGVFYNLDKISLLNKESITEGWIRSELKIALMVDILPPMGSESFNVFVSHWPSTLTELSKRKQFGGYLRRHINDVIDSSPNSNAYIIAMGDFNFEPFHEVLSDDLWATRDRTMAACNNKFLYNPFWRHLGEKTLFDKETPVSDNLCGSYFYQSAPITRWSTVDQIMFSSSFLISGNWYLDEKYSLIWKDDVLSFDLFRKNSFDHFPVISAVAFNSIQGENHE
jgi:hypothetical protein